MAEKSQESFQLPEITFEEDPSFEEVEVGDPMQVVGWRDYTIIATSKFIGRGCELTFIDQFGRVQEGPSCKHPIDHVYTYHDPEYLLLGAENKIKTTNKFRRNFESPRNWKCYWPDGDYDDSTSEYFPEQFKKDRGFIDFKHFVSVKDKTIGVGIMLDSSPFSKEENEDKEHVFFSDNVDNVNANFTPDPKYSNTIYYCSSINPSDIWIAEYRTNEKKTLPLKKRYENIQNLAFDPSGNFLCFDYYDGIKKDCVVILDRYTGEEVAVYPDGSGFHFDDTGRLRVIEDGTLKCLNTNLAEAAKILEAQQLAEDAKSLEQIDLFEKNQNTQADDISDAEKTALQGLKQKHETQFAEQLDEKSLDLKGIEEIKQALETLRSKLIKTLESEQTSYITRGIKTKIHTREQEIKTKEEELKKAEAEAKREKLRMEAERIATDTKQRLTKTLSLIQLNSIRPQIEQLKGFAGLPSELQTEVAQLVHQFTDQEATYYRTQGAEIQREVVGVFETARSMLEKIDNKSQFDVWYETELPRIRRILQDHADRCPASETSTLEEIQKTRSALNELAGTCNQRFLTQYAEIREKASKREDTERKLLKHDVDDFWDRVRERKFESREAAQQYLDSSELYEELAQRIDLFSSKSHEEGKELEKQFKLTQAQILYEISQKKDQVVDQFGRQMVQFGEISFPRWEGEVTKQRKPKKIDLIFQEDKRTRGPGIGAKDILGDVALHITNSEGHEKKVRLWEETSNETDWRLGAQEYRGKEVSESYFPQGEYRTFKKLWRNWNKPNSVLKKDWESKRAALRAKHKERQQLRKNKQKMERQKEEASLQENYQNLLDDYATFCAEKKILLLRRAEKVLNAPEPEYENEKGFVPEIKSNWVIGPEDEELLEEMARRFQMQLDLKEGILDIKGHAGTGKDVILRVFAAKTNRPLFKMDCTKWTTEADLGEDLILEVEEGASKTFKVPSAILEGTQTPGAIVYLNEFNAMPEVAQIFLHALFDESRSMTLKTRSGEIVKAAEGVLFADSRNPGYPGTFDPQWATRSRMVEMEVPYPSLHREKTEEPWDKDNPNPPYAVTEALKIARSVDSLEDLTLSPDLDHNDFVQLWEHTVNGMPANDAMTQVSAIQKFDLEVILALVQFVKKLRNDFEKNFDKSIRGSEKRNLLPVTQPVTLREMRRCAYVLSHMPEETKHTNPDQCAKDLLETEYLVKIDASENRAKIKGWLDSATSQKRLEA